MKKLLVWYSHPDLRQVEQKAAKKVCISSSVPFPLPITVTAKWRWFSEDTHCCTAAKEHKQKNQRPSFSTGDKKDIAREVFRDRIATDLKFPQITPSQYRTVYDSGLQLQRRDAFCNAVHKVWWAMFSHADCYSFYDSPGFCALHDLISSCTLSSSLKSTSMLS